MQRPGLLSPPTTTISNPFSSSTARSPSVAPMPSISPSPSPASLAPATWDDLRRSARQLENEVEGRLAAFARVAMGSGFSGVDEAERDLEDALGKVGSFLPSSRKSRVLEEFKVWTGREIRNLESRTRPNRGLDAGLDPVLPSQTSRTLQAPYFYFLYLQILTSFLPSSQT